MFERRTWMLTPWFAVIAVTLYVAFVLNVGFWRQTIGILAPGGVAGWKAIIAFGVIMVSFNAMVLGSFAHPYTLRPLLIGAVLVAAPLGYLAHEYGMGVDHKLLATALETNRAEAGDLITAKLVIWTLVLGVLPALLLWKWPLVWQPAMPRVKTNSIFIGSLAVVLIAGLAAAYGDATSLFRERRTLLAMVGPMNGVVAMTNHFLRGGVNWTPPKLAHRLAKGERGQATAAAAANKPSITVFVVGETARGDHFSINGYAKPTSPRLAAVADLVNFPNMTSCATLTADSLPCMFSGVGRSGNVKHIGYTREGLLDVLSGAGFDVMWIDNQAGCKAVCARVTTISTAEANDPKFCSTGECHDEILVDALQKKLSNITRDTVVFLHMMGSHGPAYAKRYPPAFERFKPACRSSEFSRCTRETIIAAYDNTLAYTDHVLGEIIATLQRADTAGNPTSMMYVSDHGESLGENNVYLHGVPFLFAPRAQTHVPFVAWLSPGFEKRYALAPGCLKRSQAKAVSHDNIFHTVLGMLDVRTPQRTSALDLFDGCRD